MNVFLAYSTILALCTASVNEPYQVIDTRNALLLHSAIDEVANVPNHLTPSFAQGLFTWAIYSNYLPYITTVLTHPKTKDHIPYLFKKDRTFSYHRNILYLSSHAPLKERPSLAMMNRMTTEWNLFFQAITTFGPFPWVSRIYLNGHIVHLYIAQYARLLDYQISYANKVLLLLAIVEDLNEKAGYPILLEDLKNEILAQIKHKTLEGALFVAKGIAADIYPIQPVLFECSEEELLQLMQAYYTVFEQNLPHEAYTDNPKVYFVLSYFNRHSNDSHHFKVRRQESQYLQG